jgi:hypothetical protein
MMAGGSASTADRVFIAKKGAEMIRQNQMSAIQSGPNSMSFDEVLIG